MKETEIRLPYGESYLTVKIPEKNLSYTLSTRDEKGLPDEAAAIRSSLSRPIASLPLGERVKKTDKVVVIVTDNTRPCPDDRILPPLLAELEKIVPRENITIIVALGLHPPMDEPALIKKVGKDIVRNYRVLNHDVNDTVNIGTTSRGSPVDINRRVVEADFRVSTGFIEPHLFAGFSGGRKSIAPGVFSARAAYHNHGFKMIDHPNSRPGVLRGNPIHEDMVEMAKMARLDFIVNVLLNKKREITHVVAGDPFQAHELGCALEAELAEVRAPYKADIVITTNSGTPLDLDLYQTVKGIETASRITRDGGIIISASACFAGVGPESFYEAHAGAKTPEEVLQRLKTNPHSGVPWENQILARIQMKSSLYLVSCLPENIVRDMMLTPVASTEEGLERAFKVLGNEAKIAVIPEGPLVIPVLES
ncbi:MAG: nickel-dependent lactate racemase [Chloroflexota bacterium]